MSHFTPPSVIQYLTTQVKLGKCKSRLIPVVSALLHSAKQTQHSIRTAPFNNLLGAAGKVNIQQEDQKKLDIVSNDIFVNNLKASGQVAAIISEEMDDILTCDQKGRYIVAMDPLDGSSNVDLLLDVGSIVAVWEREDSSKALNLDECLQSGNKCVFCCYIVYSAGTVCTLSLGDSTHGFTLEPSCGEFLLSHSDMMLPAKKKLYSFNEGNLEKCNSNLVKYVHSLKPQLYSLRYSGAMVADMHRILLKGGIFFYPADNKNKNGKLRLLYELIPMAFLVRGAGGLASNGSVDILDIVPTAIHQRVPIFIGSILEVQNALKIAFPPESSTKTSS